jgi:N-acetyl-anhydromuramyl-L-alanine amidase AmpD
MAPGAGPQLGGTQQQSTIGQPVGAPSGPIPTGNITGGGNWEDVNVYDPQINAAAAAHGVDPAMLKSMLIVESGGNPVAAGAGGAQGLMQLKPGIWSDEAASLGYDLNTPEGQFGMAAAILGGDVADSAGMTPEEAFLNVYYPTGCLDCAGESGHTPRQYLEDIATYSEIINGSGGGALPPISNPGGVAPGAEGSLALPPISNPEGVAPGQEGSLALPGSPAPAPGLSPAPSSGVSLDPQGVAMNATPPPIDTSFSGSLDAATTPMSPEEFRPQFIVYHMTDGPSFTGPASFDQDGDGVPDGSTNYIIEKDGTIRELVPPGSAMPWANGTTTGMEGINPKRNIVYEAAAQDNLNKQSISIEMVGIVGERITPEQLAAGQALSAHLSATYQIPMDEQHLLPHSDITTDRTDPGGSYDVMEMVPEGGLVAPEVPVGGLDPTNPVNGSTLGPQPTAQGAVYGTMAVPEQGALAPSGELISVDDESSTGWINGITPGGQGAYLEEGGYGFGEDAGAYCPTASGMRPCYENYENWDCGTCHTGTDIPTEGAQVYTATIGGKVVCSNGVGPGGGDSFSNGAGGSVGCGAYGSQDPVTGAITPGQLTVETPDGALLTYGHSSQMLVNVGDTVTPGQEIGVSGNMNGFHIHAEVQLPIGPGGSYILVDPNLYYSGHYCGQGYCPTSGIPPEQQAPAQQAPAQQPSLAPYSQPSTQPSQQAYAQSYAPPQAAAPAPATQPAAQPYTAPAAPAPTTTTAAPAAAPTYTAPQLVTDEYGRQYSIDPATGYATLVYDPTTQQAGGGPY